MTEIDPGFSTQMFPVSRFKAVDYVFEVTTSMKVMMNLLKLPDPYLTGTCDLYPHSGTLPDVTYRTPWTREKVISSSKFSITGSVFGDLEEKTRLTLGQTPERYVTLPKVKSDVDVKPSSTSESQQNLDKVALGCLFTEKINNLCKESFIKLQTDSADVNKGLLLPEEFLIVDYLQYFKRHLPTLKAKLSRLRTLPVADPLLSSTGENISKDTTLRCCVRFDKSPGVNTSDSLLYVDMHEMFVKESLFMEESLLLPDVLDAPKITTENCTAYSSIWGSVNIPPELLREKLPILDVLKQACHPLEVASMDISQYKAPVEDSKQNQINTGLIESEIPGLLVPLREIELDLILTQTPQNSPVKGWLSTFDLPEEKLSPLRQSFMSERSQSDMEVALWKAEKHPTFVVGLLLAEPEIHEAAVDFWPLSEAFNTIKLEKCNVVYVGDEIQTETINNCEFTESIGFDFSCTEVKEKVEDYKKLPPEHCKSILTSPSNTNQLSDLMNSESVAFHGKAATVDALFPKYSATETSGDTFLMQREVFNPATLNFSKPAAAITNPNAPSLYKMFPESAAVSSDHSKISMCQENCRAKKHGPTPEPASSMRMSKRGPPFRRCSPEEDLDPLSTFMILRSQQKCPGTTQSSASTEEQNVNKQTPPPPSEKLQRPDRHPVFTVVSQNATRENKTLQSGPLERQERRVVQVEATDSQQRAYCELLAFAQPCLSAAHRLGLKFPMWGDFSCLAPDQTHFLLKQQEKALCRIHAQSTEPVRDQNLLFNWAALIHVLVTFKELLLKCNLGTALEYLTKAAQSTEEQSLDQLVKRLKIILFLSYKDQESNLKLQELQQLLAAWLHSRKEQNNKEKVLVITSLDPDISSIISSLSKIDPALTTVCPEDNKTKLNGARVVSSVCNSVCAVVSEQHIGPDFPWSCFSLVVEYDHPGQSPWSTVCRERSISHLTFSTTIQDTDGKPSWCLEDNVPYVLFVTEGLLKCPVLLQMLESRFNVTLVERCHCASLQLLGGTHLYAVITVDESTAIIIQEEDEVYQDKASERVVMRLTALSLQYSCCWLILHCPDSQGGGFSSEAFSNLVLIYSSLVLFGMKSEDLDVKVLIVSDMFKLAKWISQICYHSLISSDRDPLSYLNRNWVTVMPSKEENCLLQFPCINPLVGQLMLSRAPSFQWLLGASLSQLEQLLPEVPHKVLKLFSDTTSLYTAPAGPSQTIIPETNLQSSTCTATVGSDHVVSLDLYPSNSPKIDSLCSEHNTSFLFGAENAEGSFCDQSQDVTKTGNFKLDLNCPDVLPQRIWASSQIVDKKGREEVKIHGWKSSTGAVGRVVERVYDEWMLRPTTSLSDYTKYLHSADVGPPKQDSSFSYSPILKQPASSQMSTYLTAYRDLDHDDTHQISHYLNDPADVMLWGGGLSGNHCSSSSGGWKTAPSNYGSKCWVGQERKRSEEAAGLVKTVWTPLKKGKLSYEKVPGRSDGQTRLKLF